MNTQFARVAQHANERTTNRRVGSRHLQRNGAGQVEAPRLLFIAGPKYCARPTVCQDVHLSVHRIDQQGRALKRPVIVTLAIGSERETEPQIGKQRAAVTR